MQLGLLYISTFAIFLVLDALMLRFHMQPLFQRYIGHLMLENIRVLPAVGFYAAYIAGLLYLISWPALKTGVPVLVPAAILGLMAYGTYEFTSYAIMKDWSPRMVATDVLWGGFLTAFSAWGGVAVTRLLTKA
jgi:uncharacterized membrane protein